MRRPQTVPLKANGRTASFSGNRPARLQQTAPAAPSMRHLRLVQLPAAIVRSHKGTFHIGAIPVRAMHIAEVRLMEALQSKAVPEAPRLGRLRCRNADQEGDRPEGAENEFHRVISCSRYA